MQNRTNQIDLVKLALYLLKWVWIIILCAAVGFGGMYWHTVSHQTDSYTASGTMYVYNSNPNMINYQYASSSDLSSAVRLLDTYMVVVRSNKVLDVVAERLSSSYPGITPAMISGSLSMNSVDETGVTRVRCVTGDPQLSADICNAVLDVAPAEIIRVVGAGSIEIVDYATAPTRPDAKNPYRRSMTGAMAGAVLAGGILVLIFLLNRKITDTKDLTDNFTPPVLASIQRIKGESENPSKYLLNDKSPMETIEGYAKLRMNLLYMLVGKEHHVVVVTSAVPGEGKTTITANLSVSCAMAGKRVLLIDGDMRRGSQKEVFTYSRKRPGLSDVLVGSVKWQKAVLATDWDTLDVLPAGHLPPNPAELLGSSTMASLLDELEARYDLILLDAPPINIVSDPLVLSDRVAGCLYVVRQNFSDQREMRRALSAAELTGMDVLGFVFYGEKIHTSSYYYNKRYYKNYYKKYDNRRRASAEKRKENKEGENVENDETALRDRAADTRAAAGDDTDGGTGGK